MSTTEHSTGRLIFDTRVAKGVSRKAIGELLGLSMSVVHNREKGIGRFSREEVYKIANYLQVPPESLYENPARAERSVADAYAAIERVIQQHGLESVKQFVAFFEQQEKAKNKKGG